MAFFTDLYSQFHELHDDLAKVIDDLPLEALDWVPGAEMNSIAVLIVHLCGAERYWLGDVALGDPSGRVREEEFKTRGLTADELGQRLAAADEYARQALSRLSPASLDSIRVSPRDGKAFPLGACLTYVLKHSALHLGHIQITRQLWEQKGKQA